MLVVVSSTSIFANFAVGAEVSEYKDFVITQVDSARGNRTVVEKPMFPVSFNDSQIAIGQNWTVVEPLEKGRNYHIYCFGAWIDNSSRPKTDYDIYVFNPKGLLEGEHTEAAGLPEHLGNTVNDPFFTPSETGNYSFVIVNAPGSSNSSQRGTFMAIENIQTNQWKTQYIEGKTSGNQSSFYTSWGFEFYAESPRIEVWIRVPDTLNVYEARLYVMSNEKSLFLNDLPLPWEPGLYGNSTGKIGGYNTDTLGNRGVAFDSCEYKGQDMLLNYTSSSTKKTQYHLVLIGKFGSGNVDFLVKTQFGNAKLAPTKFPARVYPGNESMVSYSSNSTNLENAAISYSTDKWNSSKLIQMDLSNKTCTAVIPPQKAGTLVQYKINATDEVANSLFAEGNFSVKDNSILNITLASESLHIGENITVNGVLTCNSVNASVTVSFSDLNATYIAKTRTMSNGTFTATFAANSTGVWAVSASFDGDNTTFACTSTTISADVEDLSFAAKNATFITGGLVAAGAAGGAVYYVRKRRE
jgi:hypothetical protein